jgi:4'-phosphopantetheinyl transferase
LSPAEQAAANRFRFERDRLHYVVAHGVLRQILSRYVGLAPAQIEFLHNAFGKPFLEAGAGEAQTQFNMSHSGDIVVVALTCGRHIGVDVEVMRPIDDFAAIAMSHFTPAERAFIDGHPGPLRRNAFFQCWTRKEALIKAVGKGLSMPLSHFDASIPPGRSGRRIEGVAEFPFVESWWITDIAVPDGHAGALAIEQGLDQIVYQEWRMME